MMKLNPLIAAGTGDGLLTGVELVQTATQTAGPVIAATLTLGGDASLQVGAAVDTAGAETLLEASELQSSMMTGAEAATQAGEDTAVPDWLQSLRAALENEN